MLNIMAYVTLIYHDVRIDNLLYHYKLEKKETVNLIKECHYFCFIRNDIYYILQDLNYHLQHVQQQRGYHLVE